MLVKNYLEYWRASLADAITQAPDDSDVEKAVTAGGWDIATGQVPPTAAADLWAAWRSANQKAADDDRPIPVLLMPLILKPKVSSAMRRRGEREFYPVILIRACMDKAGRVVMPSDGMRPCISRDFLAPTQSELTVAEMDEVDAVYAVHPDKFKEWQPAIEFATRLEALAKWDTEQFVRLPDVQILASDAPIPAVHIVRLYDWMIKRGSESEVLTRLLADPPKLNAIPFRFDTSLAKRHVGQMGSEYGLSESQRDTLNAVLADPTDSVLAINGPPGTGKTTLVQSVVASLWVKSASDGSECPLIVASSTNNQAVENVIEAFGRVKSREDDAEAAKLRDRWIPNVWSYGLSFPSEAAAKRAQQAGKNFQTYERKPTVNSTAVHFASAFADPAKWKAAAESFLTECAKHVVVQKTGGLLDQLNSARDALQAQVGAKVAQIGHLVDLFSRLAAAGAVSVPDATLEVSSWRYQANACDLDAKAKRDRAQAVREVLEAWLVHRADEPLMTLLLAFFRLREKRIARDRVFLLGIAKRIDLPGLAEIKAPNEDRVVSVIDTAASAADADAQTLELQAKDLRSEADAKDADIARWQGCGMPDHLSADELMTMLDITQRHHAFDAG